jgi:ubiquinone/menaquinone biosynthesis C-methylase UbiE
MQTQCTDVQLKVNEYFESSSDYWKEIYFDTGLLPTIYQYRHDVTLRWIRELSLPTNARILEVGCGAGLLTVALARNGHMVDAIDSTAAMLGMARKEAVDRGVQSLVRFHVADAHTLPFDAQTFDLVIAIGVIPWLHSEQAALHEMHRVLKPGGYLLATADNNARLNRLLDPLSSPIFKPLRATAKRLLELCGAWSPDSRFQPKRHYPYEVHRLIRRCSFRRVKSCTVGFGPFTFFGKQLLSDPAGVALHRRLQSLAAGRGMPPFAWTGSHYLMLATRA